MTRTKKIALLMIVFLAFCCITLGITKHENEKITAQEKEILAIPKEDVTELSWDINDHSASFYLEDDQWYATKDQAFPVNQEKITELLEQLEGVIATFKIEEVDDYKQYGLKNPQGTITVTTDDKNYTISLGDYSKLDEQRYASVDDGNVYLLKSDLLKSFDLELDDMIQLEELPDMSHLSSFELSGQNQLKIIYQEDSGYCYNDQYVYYLHDDGVYLPLDVDATVSLINEIRKISWEGYETYQLDEKDLKKYGLEEPDFEIVIEYEDEEENSQSFTLAIGEKDDHYYARIKDSCYVYEIADDVYEALEEANYDTLRPQEVIDLDWHLTEKIEISLDGKSYIINVEGEEDDLSYTYLDEKVDFDDAMTHLQDLTYTSFIDEKAEKKRELKLTIYQDVAHYQKLELEFYQYNAESCLVVFDGQSVGLVRRDRVVDLIEAINAIILA